MKKSSRMTPWRRKSSDSEDSFAPCAGLEVLRRQINDLFDNVFEGRGSRQLPMLFDDQWSTLPKLDVAETDKAVEVVVELPGMDEKDVQVTLDGRILRVCGEKKTESDKQKKNYCMSELNYGRFERVIPLPTEVDHSKAKAVFKKGVLRLNLPKAAEDKPDRKQIAIESD
ncbi:MAG: Hsp20/alpha crystallin family protein [Kiritimatiellia bacterium]|jgi:HSP20 family protein